MSWTNDVLNGLATTLATAGVGTYRADDSQYLPTEVGIAFGEIPQECDRGIAITDYGNPDDSPDQNTSTLAVQLITRGAANDRFDLNEIRDAAFNALQGLTHRQFGGAHVVQVLRVSSLPLGQDDSRRWEHADNFYLDVNPPATAYRT